MKFENNMQGSEAINFIKIVFCKNNKQIISEKPKF